MSTILLIDDSASVREVLRVALESEGYRVLEAERNFGGVAQGILTTATAKVCEDGAI